MNILPSGWCIQIAEQLIPYHVRFDLNMLIQYPPVPTIDQDKVRASGRKDTTSSHRMPDVGWKMLVRKSEYGRSWVYFYDVRGSPSVVSGPAAAALCENLLEIQILRPQLRHIESTSLGGRTHALILASPYSDSDAYWEPTNDYRPIAVG